MNLIEQQPDGILVRLHIQPGAKKSGFAGLFGDRIKIRLAAPPVDGKANKELVRFLSEYLKVPRQNIEIISGLTSRQKTVKITGKFIFHFSIR